MGKNGRRLRPEVQAATQAMRGLADSDAFKAAAGASAAAVQQTLRESQGVRAAQARMLEAVRESQPFKQLVAAQASGVFDAVRASGLAPRALRGLDDDTEAQVLELVALTADVERAEAHQRELVAELRSAGLSWASIGWATGLSGEGARRRFGGLNPQPVTRG